MPSAVPVASFTADSAAAPAAGLLAGLGPLAPLASAANRRADDGEIVFENQLAMVRLGVATALYYALRAKHAPTASHSLRVALGCSAWASRLRLPAETRDRIEVAALLHDIGKIGIPDPILRKPGKLTVEEQLTMDLYPELGCEILRGCSNDAELLNIVRYSHAWYDSRRSDDTPRGDALPLGARMLAIAGAFDAMTTDHVYRPAMSRERALAELLRGGGTQFDPDLMHDYTRMLESTPDALQSQVITRWLQQLRGDVVDRFWSSSSANAALAIAGSAAMPVRDLFHRQLLDHMYDGVLFVDSQGTITGWNRSLERITGIASGAVVGNHWMPELIGLADASGALLPVERCPLQQCLASGMQSSRHLQIRGIDGQLLPVHMHASPVMGHQPGVQGAVAILHDASSQASLEKRLVQLHEKATRDPLTGVANRAEFDSMLSELTDRSIAGGATFSLVMCDIDRFKQVNDIHGHQAGDEALVSVASLLQSHSRDGDLVSRYGGEEFVLLCPGCDNPTATRRAEAIRAAIEQLALPMLEGKSLTASFGVTEFQAGDSAETVLARADRALLRAKDTGRNQVIQLGAGGGGQQPRNGAGNRLMSWLSWPRGGDQPQITQVRLLTPVPADVAVEKLRGFIADHTAEIVSVSNSDLLVRLNVLLAAGGRRRADQRIGFQLHMQLCEEHPVDPSQHRIFATRTLVDVSLSPIRSRDRRRSELSECTDQVLASLRSYLMATVVRPAKPSA